MVKLPARLFTEDIDTQEFRVYAQLALLCQQKKTTEISISQSDLSKMCRLSRVTVNNRTQQLAKKGLIDVITRSRPDGGRDASIYVLKEIN